MRRSNRGRRAATGVAALALALLFGPPSASAAPPTIAATSFSHVTTSSALLEAQVVPLKKTTYHFEYGPADCSANPCAETPSAKIDKGEEALPVSALIEGLSPGTAYHFRLVASDADGASESPDMAFTTYFPPQAFAPCPNEAFRIGQPSALLPDCRAYEQASPTDKNGLDALGIVTTVKASPDGNGVTFNTTSPAPSDEGAAELPLYLSSRGEGAWSTQGLLPPATVGSGEAAVVGWLPGFSRAFVWAEKSTGGGDSSFLMRSSADRSLTTIVSYGAGLKDKPDFAGASADGLLAFFESKSKLLPEAVEGKPNLYVWDRETEELSLVDQDNEGEAPADGGFAGPYDWIAGENAQALSSGGSSSAYYTQDQHAIAANGSAYFTDSGDGQLYLRKNPAQPQSALDGEGNCTEPAKACTVHVSASQRTIPDPLGERPAAFMGATPDGSKAFFTSPEELTDDANTGPEPPGAPSIARADIEGKGTDLGYLPANAKGITVFGGHLYWADPKDGTIGRAQLNGSGPPSEVEADFITSAGNPQDVAVDSGHVYWTNTGELDEEGKPQDGKGTIGRAGIEGESPDLGFIEGASNPQGIAVNASNIYWGNSGSNEATTEIMRAELDGKGAEPFGESCCGPAHWDAVDLALDSTYIYLTRNEGVTDKFGCISRIELANPKNFTSFDCDFKGGVYNGWYHGIAIDGSHLYWANLEQGQIGRSALDGSSPEQEFVKDAGHPKGLALDANHIYWAANQDALPNPGNDLYRFDAETGKLTDLAPDSADVNGIEAKGVLGASEDGSSVYFSANGVPAGVANSPNGRGESATAGDCDTSAVIFGQCNLYLAREGRPLTFIARLDVGGGFESDAFDWLAKGPLASQEKTARVSGDGNVLLFQSQRRLTAYDNEGVPELYRYLAGEAAPTCVSCNPTGAPPSGAFPSPIEMPTAFNPPDPARLLARSLSADGNRAFFESTEPLVGADVDGEAGCPGVKNHNFVTAACQDVYEWEAKGTGSCDRDEGAGGCLYLLSSGTEALPSFFVDASTSGEDAFLITRSPFVGQDQDQLYDVYDARVEGGLASQSEAPPVPCEAEACKEAPTTPPPSESAGSATFSGPPNPKAKRHRKKHRHAKHRRNHTRQAKAARTQAEGR